MESRLSHLRYFSKIADSPLPSALSLRSLLLRLKFSAALLVADG
jgi:hypothetical protein